MGKRNHNKNKRKSVFFLSATASFKRNKCLNSIIRDDPITNYQAMLGYPIAPHRDGAWETNMSIFQFLKEILYFFAKTFGSNDNGM